MNFVLVHISIYQRQQINNYCCCSLTHWITSDGERAKWLIKNLRLLCGWKENLLLSVDTVERVLFPEQRQPARQSQRSDDKQPFLSRIFSTLKFSASSLSCVLWVVLNFRAFFLSLALNRCLVLSRNKKTSQTLHYVIPKYQPSLIFINLANHGGERQLISKKLISVSKRHGIIIGTSSLISNLKFSVITRTQSHVRGLNNPPLISSACGWKLIRFTSN